MTLPYTNKACLMPLRGPECSGKYGPSGPTQGNRKVVIPKPRVLAPESPYCLLKASQPSPQPHKFTELPLPDNLQSTRVMELMPVDPPEPCPAAASALTGFYVGRGGCWRQQDTQQLPREENQAGGSEQNGSSSTPLSCVHPKNCEVLWVRDDFCSTL